MSTFLLDDEDDTVENSNEQYALELERQEHREQPNMPQQDTANVYQQGGGQEEPEVDPRYIAQQPVIFNRLMQYNAARPDFSGAQGVRQNRGHYSAQGLEPQIYMSQSAHHYSAPHIVPSVQTDQSHHRARMNTFPGEQHSTNWQQNIEPTHQFANYPPPPPPAPPSSHHSQPSWQQHPQYQGSQHTQSVPALVPNPSLPQLPPRGSSRGHRPQSSASGSSSHQTRPSIHSAYQYQESPPRAQVYGAHPMPREGIIDLPPVDAEVGLGISTQEFSQPQEQPHQQLQQQQQPFPAPLPASVPPPSMGHHQRQSTAMSITSIPEYGLVPYPQGVVHGHQPSISYTPNPQRYRQAPSVSDYPVSGIYGYGTPQLPTGEMFASYGTSTQYPSSSTSGARNDVPPGYYYESAPPPQAPTGRYISNPQWYYGSSPQVGVPQAPPPQGPHPVIDPQPGGLQQRQAPPGGWYWSVSTAHSTKRTDSRSASIPGRPSNISSSEMTYVPIQLCEPPLRNCIPANPSALAADPAPRNRKKSKYTADQDKIILDLKHQGYGWGEIAQVAKCDKTLAARNRYQVLIGQQGGGTFLWNHPDIKELQGYLDEGERAKWVFLAEELTRRRGKAFTLEMCHYRICQLFKEDPQQFGVLRTRDPSSGGVPLKRKEYDPNFAIVPEDAKGDEARNSPSPGNVPRSAEGPEQNDSPETPDVS